MSSLSAVFVIFAILIVQHETSPVSKQKFEGMLRERRDLLETYDPLPIKDFKYEDKATRYLNEGNSGNLENKFSSGIEPYPMNDYKPSSSSSISSYQPQDTHEIRGKAYVDNPSGVGVGLGYRHIPSGSELSSDLRHNGHSGEATIGGKLSLHNSENSRLDAFADYTKTFNSRGFDDSRGRIGVEFKKTWRK